MTDIKQICNENYSHSFRKFQKNKDTGHSYEQYLIQQLLNCTANYKKLFKDDSIQYAKQSFSINSLSKELTTEQNKIIALGQRMKAEEIIKCIQTSFFDPRVRQSLHSKLKLSSSKSIQLSKQEQKDYGKQEGMNNSVEYPNQPLKSLKNLSSEAKQDPYDGQQIAHSEALNQYLRGQNFLDPGKQDSDFNFFLFRKSPDSYTLTTDLLTKDKENLKFQIQSGYNFFIIQMTQTLNYQSCFKKLFQVEKQLRYRDFIFKKAGIQANLQALLVIETGKDCKEIFQKSLIQLRDSKSVYKNHEEKPLSIKIDNLIEYKKVLQDKKANTIREINKPTKTKTPEQLKQADRRVEIIEYVEELVNLDIKNSENHEEFLPSMVLDLWENKRLRILEVPRETLMTVFKSTSGRQDDLEARISVLEQSKNKQQKARSLSSKKIYDQMIGLFYDTFLNEHVKAKSEEDTNALNSLLAMGRMSIQYQSLEFSLSWISKIMEKIDQKSAKELSSIFPMYLGRLHNIAQRSEEDLTIKFLENFKL